jgi:RNA polymerase sigma-54 factor
MKQSLQLKFSQQLTLTPQLQQSIRLLQMSTQELQQELEQILQENPLLERSNDVLDQATRLLADGSIDQFKVATDNSEFGLQNTVPEDTPVFEENNDNPDKLISEDMTSSSMDAYEQDSNSDWTSDVPKNNNDPYQEDSRPQLEAQQASLRDHLLAQMRAQISNHRDRALIELIIDALDDNGYLIESLVEIHESLPLELNVEIEELHFALNMLQSFEPVGVGARNLSECLCLQIKALPNVAFVTRKLAYLIADQHLHLLAQREFTKLKKLLHCDDEDLINAQQVIAFCHAKPGNQFNGKLADYVVPDVVVRKYQQQWQVFLNGAAQPRLQINQVYANLLKQNRTETSLNPQLQEARWMVKNMRQRSETILRVAQEIVTRQYQFFNHGAIAMRPLVLREIADTLGLHESTISRVTTQKFMLTPHGIFELKYFFGSHVATEAGGEASSTAIRARIKQLIGDEDQKRPLSDSKLADLLAEQGMVVARRTVAKYREALKIPPVSLRKTL